MHRRLAIAASLSAALVACADNPRSPEEEAPFVTERFALDASADAGDDAPVNTPPVAEDDVVAVEEDGEVTFNVLDNDMDADGDTLTVFIVDRPDDGALQQLGGGELTYSPRSNFVGTDRFIYGVLDGHGGSAEATVTITVGGANDAPVFVPPTPSDGAILDVVATEQLTVPLATSDMDGDPVTLAVADLATTTQPMIVGETLSWIPAVSDIGRHEVRVTASDGTATTQRQFTVAVTGQADTPCGATICTGNTVCFDGTCLPPCAVDADCSGETRCFEGHCARDACEYRKCDDGESCSLGGCFRTCEFDGECRPGQRCYGDRCAESSCADIVCALDELCVGGNCRPACEADADCAIGGCFNGGCAEDACEAVICPAGQSCDDGACVADAASGPMDETADAGGCSTVSAAPGLVAFVALLLFGRRR